MPSAISCAARQRARRSFTLPAGARRTEICAQQRGGQVLLAKVVAGLGARINAACAVAQTTGVAVGVLRVLGHGHLALGLNLGHHLEIGRIGVGFGGCGQIQAGLRDG